MKSKGYGKPASNGASHNPIILKTTVMALAMVLLLTAVNSTSALTTANTTNSTNATAMLNVTVVPITVNSTNATAMVNITALKSELLNFTVYNVIVGISLKTNLTASNITQQPAVTGVLSVKNMYSSNMQLPQHYMKLNLLKILFNSTNTTQNLETNISIGYNCSILPITLQPFVYTNSHWDIIALFSTNATRCRVTFAVPLNSTIGLFETGVLTGSSSTTTVTYSNATNSSATGGNKVTTTLEYDFGGIIILIVAGAIFYWIKERQASNEEAANPPEEDASQESAPQENNNPPNPPAPQPPAPPPPPQPSTDNNNTNK